MTVINLHSKLSGKSIDHQPSGNIVRNIAYFPVRLFYALELITDLVRSRFAIRQKIRKFINSFDNSDEFARMDSLAEFSFMHESMELLLDSVQGDIAKKIRYPFAKTIVKLIKSIRNSLEDVQKTYRKEVYPDAPDTTTIAFRKELEKTYAGFELEK